MQRAASLAATAENALRHSRTAFGLLDVSASPDKALRVRAGLDSRDLQQSVRSTVYATLEWLWGELDTSFRRPEEVIDLLVGINERLTVGTRSGNVIVRDFDSGQYPYCPATEVPRRANNLACRFVRSRDPATLINLIAASYWEIDFRGHIFADGCGKTANTFAGWLLARFSVTVPELPPRPQFIAGAYGPTGHLDLRRWRTYCNGLFGGAM